MTGKSNDETRNGETAVMENKIEKLLWRSNGMGNYFAVPAPLLQIVSIEVGTKQEIGPRQIYFVGRGGKSVWIEAKDSGLGFNGAQMRFTRVNSAQLS